LVTHGHFKVNGRKVNIPSFKVSVNDTITVKDSSKSSEKFKTFAENPKTLPSWLEGNVENFEGRVIREPMREEIDVPVNETLIVELYSK
jgi:small subunit ribosomal protein S4